MAFIANGIYCSELIFGFSNCSLSRTMFTVFISVLTEIMFYISSLLLTDALQLTVH